MAESNTENIHASTSFDQNVESGLLSLSQSIPVKDAAEILNFYDFNEILGQGSFGTVIKAKSKVDRSVRAIKIIQMSAAAVREALVLQQLSPHPQIISLYEVYANTELIFLVQEFCEIQLLDLIPYLKSAQVRDIGIQLLKALDYLQSKEIVHRDIKPENIMIKAEGGNLSVKLIDFGLAVSEHSRKPLISAAGTSYYIAPEVIKNEYGSEADIWSVGIVLAFMLNKELPFRGVTSRQIYEEIVKFDPKSLQFSPNAPIQLQKAVKSMLQPEPRFRAKPSELLAAVV